MGAQRAPDATKAGDIAATDILDSDTPNVHETPSSAVHIDLHGQPFHLPTFTIAQIRAAIPPHCFVPSTTRSLAYVVRDFFYFSALVYLTQYIALVPSPVLRFALWAAYTIVQGMVMTGIWILAHECGHGAFSNSKSLNNVLGLIMHSFLLVPFHSWRITHSAHHKATGNIERDTAFVPHKRESWLQKKFGAAADETAVEFAHLVEDAPIVTLWWAFVHQLLGWPGYLLFNWTGQTRNDAGFPRKSHFWFGEDTIFWKKDQIGSIMLSDFGVAAMIACLVVAGQICGSWNVVVLYAVPYLWVNHWIVAITFLQHTDGSLPHYSNSTWSFTRGATATIDRDLGFIDTHLFHDIIGTHVCHHLVSTIPFYYAGEASIHIRRVMGTDYKSDTKTPFFRAFWSSMRSCQFVEETTEGSGVWMFRNLYKGNGTDVRDLTGGKEEHGNLAGEKKDKMAAAVTTSMLTSKNLDAKRRFSASSGRLVPTKNLPMLAE